MRRTLDFGCYPVLPHSAVPNSVEVNFAQADILLLCEQSPRLDENRLVAK